MKLNIYDDPGYRSVDLLLQSLHDEFLKSNFKVRFKPSFHRYPSSYIIGDRWCIMIEHQIKNELR